MKIKREIYIFLTILILLAAIWHSDLLTDPMGRVDLMSQRGNYAHPFIWSISIYVIVLMVRVSVKKVIRFFRK